MESTPKGWKRIVELIGEDAARRIVETYGGGVLYVPQTKNLPPSHPLATLIGFDLAIKLAEHWLASHHYLRVPTRRDIRNQEVCRDIYCRFVEKNESARSIARSFGMTERSVFRIVARQRELIA